MNSCDMPSTTPAPERPARVTAAGSRVHRFVGGTPGTWLGVSRREYKQPAEHHCGVTRTVLAGESGERTSFQVRYFEIAPAGFSSLERHEHEHVVLVFRGTGQVRLGDAWHEVVPGDAVYVAPQEIHQLRNTGGEPFGFFCVVDAERDRPVPVGEPD